PRVDFPRRLSATGRCEIIRSLRGPPPGARNRAAILSRERVGMKTTGIYARDWFIALVIGLALGVAAVARSPWLERLELAAYDVGVAATHRLPGAAERVALVAIDDRSVEEIGPRPWPRDVLAQVLTRLAAARPAAIGVLLDLGAPQS